MKRILLSFSAVLISLALGAVIGYYFGNQKGHHEGFEIGKSFGISEGIQIGADRERQVCENRIASETMESLKARLGSKETKTLSDYISIEAHIADEWKGGFFSGKYVYFLEGQLFNDATAASINQVRVQLNFETKGGMKLGSREVIIDQVVGPKQKSSFRKLIDIPQNIGSWSYRIVDVTSV